MNLRLLASDIQEQLLSLPRQALGRDSLYLRKLQAIALEQIGKNNEPLGVRCAKIVRNFIAMNGFIVFPRSPANLLLVSDPVSNVVDHM